MDHQPGTEQSRFVFTNTITLTLTSMCDILSIGFPHYHQIQEYWEEDERLRMGTHNQEQNTSPEQTYYTIEQVAQRTGMTKRTLRYYEEMGLLPPTGRTEGNYRRYSDEDIFLLKRIKELRDLLGFSLTDIRTLLDAEDERVQIKLAYSQETEVTTKLAQLDRVDELIREQIQLIEQKITALDEMRSALYAKLEKHQHTRENIQNTSKNT
jgi:MerR family transcriptional regulator, repressor of the yfmOP operon